MAGKILVSRINNDRGLPRQVGAAKVFYAIIQFQGDGAAATTYSTGGISLLGEFAGNDDTQNSFAIDWVDHMELGTVVTSNQPSVGAMRARWDAANQKMKLYVCGQAAGALSAQELANSTALSGTTAIVGTFVEAKCYVFNGGR